LKSFSMGSCLDFEEEEILYYSLYSELWSAKQTYTKPYVSFYLVPYIDLQIATSVPVYAPWHNETSFEPFV
jgi:hypothetical protein